MIHKSLFSCFPGGKYHVFTLITSEWWWCDVDVNVVTEVASAADVDADIAADIAADVAVAVNADVDDVT